MSFSEGTTISHAALERANCIPPGEHGSSLDRAGVEQFDYAVWIPDTSAPGLFRASRTEGRPAFFSQEGAYYKRLERIARLAGIGATTELLEASGLHIESETAGDNPQHNTITLATDSLATIHHKTNRLAEAGVVTPGPRMRVGLHTESSLFSMPTLVEAVHNRTVLIGCMPSIDPATDRANNVEKVHDLLDHAAAALVRSDEIVQLEMREAGKRLQGLPRGVNSEAVQTYASTYDDTSTVKNVLALLHGDMANAASWQYLWGVNDAEMPGIVERWHEQLNGLVVPQR